MLAPTLASAAPVSYRCSGDAAYSRALQVRSVIRDFDDAEALFRDDVDHSMPLAHGSPWRVGGAGYVGFESIPAFPCEGDAAASQTLSSLVDRYEAVFFDTRDAVEVRLFHLDSADTLDTGIPTRSGTQFFVGHDVHSLGMTGGVVRTAWVNGVYGYEPHHGSYLRLGTPFLGLSADVLLPSRTPPDYRIAADDLYEQGAFTVAMRGEDRTSDHLVFVEPRVGIAKHENESHAGGYLASAVALDPGGFQSATAGLDFDGRGITPEDVPVMQVRLHAFAEVTAFDLARASHPGPPLPHSVVGGFTAGLGVSLGGSMASFGFDMRAGVNRPALLRDLPAAHGHGDILLVSSMRMSF